MKYITIFFTIIAVSFATQKIAFSAGDNDSKSGRVKVQAGAGGSAKLSTGDKDKPGDQDNSSKKKANKEKRETIKENRTERKKNRIQHKKIIKKADESD